MTDRVEEIEARVSAEPCDGQMVVTFVGENDYREKSCNKCGKDSHYVSPLTGDEAKFLLSTIRALQAEAGELRPEVLEFAKIMESKLRENDHKAGWKGDDPEALSLRCQQELVELQNAFRKAFCATYWPIRPGETGATPQAQFVLRLATEDEHEKAASEIGGEAADVANFAMMIWDVCRLAALKDTLKGPVS
jgi:NTP pyrophosphatase (non-canonical NTP hydrolase)